MKKLIMQATVGLLVGGAIMSAVAGGPDVAPAPMVTPGLYVGLGGAYGSHFVSRQYGITDTPIAAPFVLDSSLDQLDNTNSKFAPLAQIGYWAPIDDEWLWGVQVTYKYLNYTVNSDSYTGSLLQNATGLASLNSAKLVKTSFQNELLLLAYGGMQFDKGYFYLGVGAAMWTVRDHFGVAVALNNVVTNGNNFTNFFTQTGTLWGGAFQVGYNYYMKSDWFLGLNYTYALSGTFSKSETANANAFNNAAVINSNNVTVTRTVSIETQEFMFSVNKVFQF